MAPTACKVGAALAADPRLAVLDTEQSDSAVAAALTDAGHRVSRAVVQRHRTSACVCARPATVDGVLAPAGGWAPDATRPATRRPDARTRVAQPAARYGPQGRLQEVTSPPIPDDVDEATALGETLRLLGALVPAGYRAVLAEVSLDEAAWHRDGQGRDAVTRPCRRYRWQIVADADTADLLTDEEWAAHRRALGRVRVAARRPVRGARGDVEVVASGLADLQSGQGDGDGPEGLLRRMRLVAGQIADDVADAERAGYRVTRIVIPALGDLVEGTVGYYSNSLWLVRLDRRQQVTLARRLIRDLLIDVAAIGLPVLVPVVPGNHGENRQISGKALTDPASDNDDLAVMEQVQDILAMHPELAEQVTLAFPQPGRYTLVTEHLGLLVGWAHGHLHGHGSGAPIAKMTAWLKGQTLSREPIGDADVYVTGHYHSTQYSTLPGRRVWVQVPALCDESSHFSQSYGLNGGPSCISFLLTVDGVDRLRTHRLPVLEDAA